MIRMTHPRLLVAAGAAALAAALLPGTASAAPEITALDYRGATCADEPPTSFTGSTATLTLCERPEGDTDPAAWSPTDLYDAVDLYAGDTNDVQEILASGNIVDTVALADDGSFTVDLPTSGYLVAMPKGAQGGPLYTFYAGDQKAPDVSGPSGAPDAREPGDKDGVGSGTVQPGDDADAGNGDASTGDAGTGNAGTGKGLPKTGV